MLKVNTTIGAITSPYADANTGGSGFGSAQSVASCCAAPLQCSLQQLQQKVHMQSLPNVEFPCPSPYARKAKGCCCHCGTSRGAKGLDLYLVAIKDCLHFVKPLTTGFPGWLRNKRPKRTDGVSKWQRAKHIWSNHSFKCQISSRRAWCTWESYRVNVGQYAQELMA